MDGRLAEQMFGRGHIDRDASHVASCAAAGGYAVVRVAGGGGVTEEPPPTKRPIRALMMPDVEPGAPPTGRPSFTIADPCALLVDEAYQRTLSDRSVRLIRRIVARWDWRRFKPPVVAMTDAGLEVIDGQHTAIAAASHPLITEIPIMLVEAAERVDRAQAFIGHNRDRVNITPMQMHHAAVAAGDDDALTVNQVCQRAGVRVLRTPPAANVFRPGETLAVTGIAALINRHGPIKARIILEVLAKAKAAPLLTAQLRAVEALLHDPEYRGQVEPEDITTAVIALGEEASREAHVFAAAHKVPIWRALAVVLFRRARRGRRRAA